MVKSLIGGAAAHTVFTDLDDQKLLSRGMGSIKSTVMYIFLKYFYFFKSIIKALQNLLSPK